MVMTLNSHNNIDKTVGGLVNKKIIQLSKVCTAVLWKRLFEKSLHCSSWTTIIVSIDLKTYKKSYYYTTATTTTTTTTSKLFLPGADPGNIVREAPCIGEGSGDHLLDMLILQTLMTDQKCKNKKTLEMFPPDRQPFPLDESTFFLLFLDLSLSKRSGMHGLRSLIPTFYDRKFTDYPNHKGTGTSQNLLYIEEIQISFTQRI